MAKLAGMGGVLAQEGARPGDGELAWPKINHRIQIFETNKNLRQLVTVTMAVTGH